METHNLIPREDIKQEPDYEITGIAERNIQLLQEKLKMELDDDDAQTVKKEADGEEESDTSPTMKMARESLTSPHFPEEESFLYCEKCQFKYEGSCPHHGPIVYIDNAENGKVQGCSKDDKYQVQEDDNKDRQAPGRRKVEQDGVCAAHSDDVGKLTNEDRSTESDKMFSVCEMDNELCVAGTSCGAQSNVVIKTHQKIHSTVKPFTCDLCGAVFAYYSGLHRHKRTHTGEKPYKCDVCGVGLTRNGDLKNHKRIHTGEKPYKCDVCDVGFTASGALRTHYRIHTGERPYKCDVCGIGFTQSGDLKNHKRTHTGEKPYRCDVCGVGFSESGALKRHYRTHTGEKPYKCDVCSVGFTRSGDLKSHKRTHTGEKPYKCDVCGLGFTRCRNLNSHTKALH